MYKKIVYIITALISLLFTSNALCENLVVNGDFEAADTGWTEWYSTAPWFNDPFDHDYTSGTDIWVPTPYPFEDSGSHSQRRGSPAVHGGIYQVIDVIAGRYYTIQGMWSGGIGGLVENSNTSAAWFEVSIYQGAVGAALIDAGPGDYLIAKREHSGTSVYFFDWEAFTGKFKAQTNQVTLALKTGRLGDWDAVATYHDNLKVELATSWNVLIPAITSKAASQ